MRKQSSTSRGGSDRLRCTPHRIIKLGYGSQSGSAFSGSQPIEKLPQGPDSDIEPKEEPFRALFDSAVDVRDEAFDIIKPRGRKTRVCERLCCDLLLNHKGNHNGIVFEGILEQSFPISLITLTLITQGFQSLVHFLAPDLKLLYRLR